MINIDKTILEIVAYGIDKNLIEKRDSIYMINRFLKLLNLQDFKITEFNRKNKREIWQILEDFRKFALENNLVEDDSIEVLDIFDTEVMDILAKRPSEIEKDFWSLYEKSPKMATEYHYNFSKNINYIRENRIKKDIKWKYQSSYGQIDLSINMSKPEKKPRDIEKAKSIENYNYPKCLLCKENEGYAGRIDYPARDNHRIIGLTLSDESWFIQYSPYAYYHEHCIVFKGSHHPMRINKKTFRRLLDFVEKFPHYCLGSNADLPIVGGSILSHDHYQGGGYSFSLSKAEERNTLQVEDGIKLSTLKWPMSVIRLKGKEIEPLVDLSFKILKNWQDYEDESVDIISHTGKTPHNTITPVARFKDGKFEMDLVLRNNRRNRENPHGIFNPRQEYHNIKKENIGIIECMGLAVLPARLEKELRAVKKYILADDLEAIKRDEALSKHYSLALQVKEKHPLNKDKIDEKIKEEIGIIFTEILKDAGIFKGTVIGQKAFKRCLERLIK